jgi:Major intrinsic protein
VSSDRFPPDTQQTPRQRHGVRIAELLEREPPWSREFADLSHEWRRLFSELFGTFMLVIVGAGGAVVDAKTADGIGRTADVVAPGLLVLTVILFMGAVSGAHLNPVVSIAFALRQDFQWRRVPGYILADMRCGGGLSSAARSIRNRGSPWCHAAPRWLHQHSNFLYRDPSDDGVGQYHPVYRVQRSKHRSPVGSCSGGIHGPRGPVAQPSQWRADESRSSLGPDLVRPLPDARVRCAAISTTSGYTWPDRYSALSGPWRWATSSAARVGDRPGPRPPKEP